MAIRMGQVLEGTPPFQKINNEIESETITNYLSLDFKQSINVLWATRTVTTACEVVTTRLDSDQIPQTRGINSNLHS